MKQIEIVVDKAGGVKIEAKNFSGTSCTDATRPFESALGVVTTNQFKPEYYETQTEHAEEHN